MFFSLQRQGDRPAEPVEHDREAAGPQQVGRPQSDQQQRAQDSVGVTLSSGGLNLNYLILTNVRSCVVNVCQYASRLR